MLIILYHYIKTLIGYIITRKTTIYCKNCLISSLKVLLMHFITKQIKLCFLCTYNNQLDQVAWKLLAINFWQLMKLFDCYITKLLLPYLLTSISIYQSCNTHSLVRHLSNSFTLLVYIAVKPGVFLYYLFCIFIQMCRIR